MAERIDVRRGEIGVSIDAQIAPALVVGEDDEDIGMGGFFPGDGQGRDGETRGGWRGGRSKGAGESLSWMAMVREPVPDWKTLCNRREGPSWAVRNRFRPARCIGIESGPVLGARSFSVPPASRRIPIPHYETPCSLPPPPYPRASPLLRFCLGGKPLCRPLGADHPQRGGRLAGNRGKGRRATGKHSLGWGSVLPVQGVKVEGDTLTVTRISKSKNAGTGSEDVTTETITAHVSGDEMKLEDGEGESAMASHLAAQILPASASRPCRPRRIFPR